MHSWTLVFVRLEFRTYVTKGIFWSMNYSVYYGSVMSAVSSFNFIVISSSVVFLDPEKYSRMDSEKVPNVYYQGYFLANLFFELGCWLLLWFFHLEIYYFSCLNLSLSFFIAYNLLMIFLLLDMIFDYYSHSFIILINFCVCVCVCLCGGGEVEKMTRNQLNYTINFQVIYLASIIHIIVGIWTQNSKVLNKIHIQI